MRKIGLTVLLILYVLFLGAVNISFAQQTKPKSDDIDELKKLAPKVFIDCSYCDRDYIRTEITFVNYVWDRKEADVHILITTQSTGASGTEYTIAFIGQNTYKDFKNTLKYVCSRDDTEDTRRKGLVRMLKLGLVSLAARTPIKSQLDISVKKKAKAIAAKDKWNFWVFSVGINAFFSGETSYSHINMHGNISANRITPESKLRLGISASYNENRFEFEDESIVSTAKSQYFNGKYVKSLAEHWSVGLLLNVVSSTYSNLNLSIRPAPAVEYNLFPYSKSTRRQLRFLYSLGYKYADYREKTIYEKESEHLLSESLSVTLEMKEQWGNVEATLEGSHYFHDFSKYRFSIFADLSIRLIKGLRLNLFGRYSQIHDQLGLSKGAASLDEVLLFGH